MENCSIFSELYDFFKQEYGVFNMSLTVEAGCEGVVEIEMRQSGLMLLMNDLMLLKASKDVANVPQDENQCTFDEAMQFAPQ